MAIGDRCRTAMEGGGAGDPPRKKSRWSAVPDATPDAPPDAPRDAAALARERLAKLSQTISASQPPAVPTAPHIAPISLAMPAFPLQPVSGAPSKGVVSVAAPPTTLPVAVTSAAPAAGKSGSFTVAPGGVGRVFIPPSVQEQQKQLTRRIERDERRGERRRRDDERGGEEGGAGGPSGSRPRRSFREVWTKRAQLPPPLPLGHRPSAEPSRPAESPFCITGLRRRGRRRWVGRGEAATPRLRRGGGGVDGAAAAQEAAAAAAA